MIYAPKDYNKIEEHFKQYVSVSYPGIKPEDLPEIQLNAIKDAFYGAWGQCLLNQRDNMPLEDEEKAVSILENFIKQVSDYYTARAGRNQ